MAANGKTAQNLYNNLGLASKGYSKDELANIESALDEGKTPQDVVKIYKSPLEQSNDLAPEFTSDELKFIKSYSLEPDQVRELKRNFKGNDYNTALERLKGGEAFGDIINGVVKYEEDDDFDPEWEEEKLADELGVIPYAKGTTLGQVIKDMQAKYTKLKPERVAAIIKGDGYLGFKADNLDEPWDAYLDRMHEFYDGK